MAKANGKVDRRILRTRKAIADAFDSLAARDDISKITVSAIAREADIDRKTFYLHYSSIDDLMFSRTEMIMEAIIEAIRKYSDKPTRKERLHLLLSDVNDIILTNRDMHVHMAAALSTDRIMDALAEVMSPAFEKTGVDASLANDMDFRRRMRFYLSGAISVYRSWLLSGDDTPIEEISALIEEELDTDTLPDASLLNRLAAS